MTWVAIRRGHLQVAPRPRQARQVTIRFGIGNSFYVAGTASQRERREVDVRQIGLEA
jgi:hypothetical protein